MKNTIKLFLLVLISGFIVTSCNDEFDTLSEDQNSISVRSDEDPNSSDDIARENPFTVQNMNSAYRDLYGTSGNLNLTHYYVKFSPLDIEELNTLIDEEIEFFDFPLDREVPEFGEGSNRTISEDNLGEYYAVLEPNYRTALSYEVLAELYLGEDDANLIETAYTRLGYDPEEEGYFYKDEGDETDPEPTGYIPSPENDPHFDGDLIVDVDCACKQGLHKRNPAGCITVEDNRLSNGNCDKAVRHVKVILKNSWFSSKTVYTDKFGCFKRLWKYKGTAKMWVEFENQHVTIRGTEGNILDFWDYTKPVKDYVGKFYGPNFNNMDVCYSYPTSTEGNDLRFWKAAMINNGVFEFRDWSSVNNLIMPVADLKVLMTPWTNSAAAPMIDKMFDVTGPVIDVDPQYGAFLFALGAILDGPLFENYVSIFKPDLVFNTRGVPESDQFKATIYRELALAQHFTWLDYPNVPAIEYWLAYLTYIVENLGYGDGTAPDAGRVQVIENWGWTMGPTIAHDAYGDDASVFGGHDCQMEARVLVENHIQAGWLNDIHDYRHSECFSEPVTDGCGGYSHDKFLGLMDVNTESPSEFKSRFISTFLNPNDLPVFEQLCSQYGL